jgi:raffinose/stachyose/melibiose transport system substrate-binding protein
MKRFIGFLMVFVLAFTMLAACGTNTPATQTPQSGGTSSPTTAPASSEKIRIEFFQQKEAAAVEPYNQLIQGFMAENPNVVIEQTYVPDAPQVFASRVASGDIPDLFTHWPERSTFWELCKQDIMLPITGADYLNKVDPNLLERCMYKGEVYCLPIAMLTFGVVYNVDMYAKYGYTTPPSTWTEFIGMLDKMKADGQAGISWQMQFNEGLGQQINAFYKMALGDYNANVFFAQLARGETTFDEHPEAKEVVYKYIKLHEYGTEDKLADDVQKMNENLVNGKAACFISGTWNFGSIAGINKDFNYMMHPMPLFDDTSKNIVPVGIDTGLCINKKSKYTDVLLKLFDFVGNGDGCYLYCKAMNNQPILKDVDYTVKQLEPMVETLNAGKIFRFPHHFWQAGLDLECANALVTLILSNHTEKDYETYFKTIENLFKNAGPTEFQGNYTQYK